MEELIRKYERKLIEHGLCEPHDIFLGGLDADLAWNRVSIHQGLLEAVVAGLNINSLLFARPAQPYRGMIDSLTSSGDTLTPKDCETRTFLHDMPIVRTTEPEPIIAALKRRKCVILPGMGIATYGTVSPEQAFVTFSSVCFAIFVKFFLDYYELRRNQDDDAQICSIIDSVEQRYRESLERASCRTPRRRGPFRNTESVIQGMGEAGMATVSARLVDSFFGNISYRLDGTIFMSQTASSLDELSGCIDACPMDGSSCVGLTASSEYSAHRQILTKGTYRSILHGHPKFSVIRSMICDEPNCTGRGSCHLDCPRARHVREIPIVPGEVGTGRYGLSRTVPPVIERTGGVIVYSHGVFTGGKYDFIMPYQNLLEIEQTCFEEYFAALR